MLLMVDSVALREYLHHLISITRGHSLCIEKDSMCRPCMSSAMQEGTETEVNDCWNARCVSKLPLHGYRCSCVNLLRPVSACIPQQDISCRGHAQCHGLLGRTDPTPAIRSLSRCSQNSDTFPCHRRDNAQGLGRPASTCDHVQHTAGSSDRDGAAPKLELWLLCEFLSASHSDCQDTHLLPSSLFNFSSSNQLPQSTRHHGRRTKPCRNNRRASFFPYRRCSLSSLC